ncbi:hypothetical protein [Nonomuraea sp. NPDC049646]|uniref:hypothetical protein n=1 Tax=unclassified Nonomuraea TaxID=2593643 RepID=UPI0037B80BDF
MLISLGWIAAGVFFVFAVNGGQVWPNAYRFLLVYVGLQIIGMLCAYIGRTRYRAWSEPVGRSSGSRVADADPMDAEGAT